MRFIVKVLALGVFNGVFILNVNGDYDDAQEQTTPGDYGADFRRQDTMPNTEDPTTRTTTTTEQVTQRGGGNENAVKWDCIVGWHWQCEKYCEKYRPDCDDCAAMCKPESSFFGHCDCIRTPHSVMKHKQESADGIWPKGISF